MKRAFTLIELMIVIAVIVTLMAMTFRIGGIGAESEARTTTITRLQRLENCLSGFHAAFGCYPPVELHGNRSFEGQEESINWGNEGQAWEWVQRICKTQPVACRFPFPQDMSPYITELSDLIAAAAGSGEYEEVFKDEYMQEWARAGFKSAGDSSVEGKLQSLKDKVLWSDLKLFQYGVMSYLLPRYFVMMGGSSSFYEGGYAQWMQNNQNPSDPFTGSAMAWSLVYDWVGEYRQGQKNENIVKLQMMPSQAVCARWLPNLEGICKCNLSRVLFGVDIKSSDSRDGGVFDSSDIEYMAPALYGACFSPDGEGSYTDQYLLDGITVNDGWGEEFYYCSRAPYQSYTLWSAGPNKKTFPPWIAQDRLSAREQELKAKWSSDDITHMSN